jgi:hypothetical protein
MPFEQTKRQMRGAACRKSTDAAPPDDGGVPACAAICGGDGGVYTAQQQAEGAALLNDLGACAASCQGP